MKEKLNIDSIRHLEDLDNFSFGKRDGNIIEGQDELARKYAENLANEIKMEDRKGVLFLTSSKKRCLQTADLISIDLKRLNPKIKIKIVSNQELNSLDEGIAIVPEDYKEGDKFDGFPLAANAMLKEAHATDFGGEKDNYLYKYGDPVLQDDGNYKYPELIKYFKTAGESYRDFLLRIYNTIKETAQKAEKFGENTKVVVICHAQVAHILKDIQSISEKVKSGEVEIENGELPRMCWREFIKRYENKKLNQYKEDVAMDFMLKLDISNLLNPEITRILDKEIVFLKELK